MGIYKSYDELLGRWKWEGFGFVRYYDTEAEADADQASVWEEHNHRLEVNKFVSEMLILTCKDAEAIRKQLAYAEY